MRERESGSVPWPGTRSTSGDIAPSSAAYHRSSARITSTITVTVTVRVTVAARTTITSQLATTITTTTTIAVAVVVVVVEEMFFYRPCPISRSIAPPCRRPAVSARRRRCSRKRAVFVPDPCWI